jgi:hypothetical protein
MVVTASETRDRWTIGVGGEYAFVDWLTGFLEYDYYNFRNSTNTFVCAGCSFLVATAPINVTTNVTDCSVVALKRGNARGAKGAGHRL